MDFSDSKSPQVSRTTLSTLADFINTVVWIVSIYPVVSHFNQSLYHLITLPKVPITIGIRVSLMFYNFFNSLARSRYLSFFSLSFNCTLWSAETAKSTILENFLFVYFFLIIWLILEFFTPALVDSFPLKSELQQVSCSLHDSSLYSG